MMAQTIRPHEAKRLVDQGAILIDIREANEHAREHIPGARHEALSRLGGPIERAAAPAVIFHCRSGARTAAAAERLAPLVGTNAYVLEGGIEAWKAAGLPVSKDTRQPLEMMRQVQIAAGSLVLLGVLLGALLHPGFYALSGFVGAGLVFAGVTGTCGMTRLLSFAPWNRAVARPARA
jgi:rhodanese-related sulfurtransferase